MKKIISLIFLLCLILSFSACGNKEITVTMQEIYDASNLEALLENHESVYIRYTESGEIYEELYLSKEYSYSFMDGEVYGIESDVAFLTTNDSFYYYDDNNYVRSFLISKDGLTDAYNPLDDVKFVFDESGLQETIESIEKKDGNITVISFNGPEAIEASGEEGLVSYNAEYVLDEETRELISTKAVLEYDDGTVYNVVMDFVYDGEIPEGMKALVDYEQRTDDLRTITVVSNPGTEGEKSESVQVPKGISVIFEPDLILDIDLTTIESTSHIEGAFDLYSDSACTQPLDMDEDKNSDVTVYVKWYE